MSTPPLSGLHALYKFLLLNRAKSVGILLINREVYKEVLPFNKEVPLRDLPEHPSLEGPPEVPVPRWLVGAHTLLKAQVSDVWLTRNTLISVLTFAIAMVRTTTPRSTKSYGSIYEKVSFELLLSTPNLN